MCGICGVAGASAGREVLEKMGTAIAHRGPDDAAYLDSEGAGFAFRRLSIIDVAGGRQPIWNEDGTLAIILNGEIYNHHGLRSGLEARGHAFWTRSDVETVLHLYEEKRERALDEMRGMFALAIWDARRRELFLARDRAGKKPLYYTQLADGEGTLVFGSEIKAIIQHPAVARRPDLSAIDHFLTLQYVPSPLTAFEGIRRLPPAHWLRWREGRVETERYWRLEYLPKFTEAEPELREEMLRLLRESVAIRLESEVPLGAFLSGGIDSSAVVAFAAEAMTEPLKTFSIGFEPASHDESEYARMVAERFATDHHELVVKAGAPEAIDDIVWHYDQPFGDSSAVPSFAVSRITRPHVTVVLNGDGGDESFAGYDRYRLIRFARFFALPRPLRKAAYKAAGPASRYLGRAKRLAAIQPDSPDEAYFATLVHASAARRRWLYQGSLAAIRQESPPLQLLRAHSELDVLDRLLATDVNSYLPDDLLVKMDVATMAHSLEGRSPFLDHQLMEFMARVPPNLKLNGGVSKYLLKTGLRGILPDPVLDRPKMGFGVPLAHWLRTSLKDVLVDTVLAPRALQRGYFRPEAVRHMVEAHVHGSDDFQYTLWDLLLLEQWHRTYIDAAPEPRPPILPLAAVAAR
jgi:asparagine synthase (glutamine-hydrolysing)